ncbi:MAG: hypothetical protein CL484_12315 [Acidobacteria bacterium]|nr:hypothetical protein [Acidobacteriota bacterium]|tara:strand:+ start:8750 stop:9310 length:561 start_codon:yes stop_codon:yes gene_type:complete
MAKTLPILGLLVLLTAPASGAAQNTTDAIAKALLAAPAALQAEAMVIRLAANGTHTVLREGSNGLVCWDRSDEPSRSFSVQCTSEENLARVKQNRVWSMSGRSADDLRALREAAEADGTREVSKFGSVYYSLNGADAGSASLHTTIAVPFATSESFGLPDQGNYTAAGTWIMEAGNSSAHIMLPGQ